MDVQLKVILFWTVLVNIFTGNLALPRYRSSYQSRRNIALEAAKFYKWETPILPGISQVSVDQEIKPHFHGKVMDVINSTCDKDCQRFRSTQPDSVIDLKTKLKFETLDLEKQVSFSMSMDVDDVPSGVLRQSGNPIDDVIQDEELENFETPGDFDEDFDNLLTNTEAGKRSKREIFGLDMRFTIPSKEFLSTSPFSTAVKISTGCSGIMLSPTHVLTSAHCVHDGKRYIKGVRKLKVGKLTDIPKRRKGKGKKKGRGLKKNRKGRKGKRKPKKEVEETVESNRVRRSIESTNQPRVEPYFKWTRAKNITIPQEWIMTPGKRSSSDYPIEYDYAVITLSKPIGKDFMDLGISPERQKIPGKHNVHFTGFDNDRPDKFVYRFCPVEEESSDIIYHYCDAKQGTSGSGVYIKLFDEKKQRWYNRVVALFSGHQLVTLPDGTSKSYNTAMRITALKYAQICYWVNNNSYENCRG